MWGSFWNVHRLLLLSILALALSSIESQSLRTDDCNEKEKESSVNQLITGDWDDQITLTPSKGEVLLTSITISIQFIQHSIDHDSSDVPCNNLSLSIWNVSDVKRCFASSFFYSSWIIDIVVAKTKTLIDFFCTLPFDLVDAYFSKNLFSLSIEQGHSELWIEVLSKQNVKKIDNIELEITAM